MKLEKDGCLIVVDAEAARGYYERHGVKKDGSCCSKCRDFVACAPDFPKEAKEFFASCGIDDMLLVSELSPYYMVGDELLIGGIYHTVGTMEGGKPPKSAPDPMRGLRRFLKRIFNRPALEAEDELERIVSLQRYSPVFTVCEGFSVMFSNQTDFLPEGFPENSLQINLTAYIPWVIDEPCE